MVQKILSLSVIPFNIANRNLLLPTVRIGYYKEWRILIGRVAVKRKIGAVFVKYGIFHLYLCI